MSFTSVGQLFDSFCVFALLASWIFKNKRREKSLHGHFSALYSTCCLSLFYATLFSCIRKPSSLMQNVDSTSHLKLSLSLSLLLSFLPSVAVLNVWVRGKSPKPGTVLWIYTEIKWADREFLSVQNLLIWSARVTKVSHLAPPPPPPPPFSS